jgi:hypothetical protein
MLHTHTICGSNQTRTKEVLARATSMVADQRLENLESRHLFAGTGLQGDYFNNADFTSQVMTRTDATINANWGTSSPTASMQADSFSVRWTGQVMAPTSGTYSFYTRADDGVRLWVNGQLIIDRWSDRTLTGDVNHDGSVNSLDFNMLVNNLKKPGTPETGDLNGDGMVTRTDLKILRGNWAQTVAPQEDSGTIALQAGQRYDIKLEYYNKDGLSSVQLLWSGPGISKSVVPMAQLYAPGAPVADPPPDTITGLTLMNADTNQPISALKDGATIDLATLPTKNISVRADTTAASGSIMFGLDGNARYRTDNTAPYSLNGATGDDYTAWTPAVGAHSITVTAYSAANGTGTAGQAITVKFGVADSTPAPAPIPTPTPTPTPTDGPPSGVYDYVIHPGQSIGSVSPKPGQWVEVTAGTYGAFTFPASGTATAPIHYHFDSGAVVDAKGSPVAVQGGQYLDINGLVERNCSNTLQIAAVRIDTGTVIRNSLIERNDSVGLGLFGTSPKAINVTMQWNGQEGYVGNGIVNGLMKDCKIFHNDYGLAYKPAWIDRVGVPDSAGYVEGLYINGLYYVDPGWEGGGGKFVGTDGMVVDGVESGWNMGVNLGFDIFNKNATIRNCYFHDVIHAINAFDHGAGAWSANDLSFELGDIGNYLVENNKFDLTSTNSQGVVISAARNVIVRNNTFIGRSDNSSIAVCLVNNQRSSPNVDHITVSGNSFMYTRIEAWDKTVPAMYSISFDGDSFVGTSPLFKWYANGILKDYSDLAAVRSGLGFELGGTAISA